MKWVDTNIFIHYFTDGDPLKTAASLALFQRVRDRLEVLMLSEAVVAEIVYVLSSRGHYNLSHADIVARLNPVLRLPGIKLPHKRICLRALDIYASSARLDFEDALGLAHMERVRSRL
ncbi:MAG: PIN domain-containing protein [Chloroflexia bacterium]|nr:PIN domain-containing protein [Chloroflexia bacterium]